MNDDFENRKLSIEEEKLQLEKKKFSLEKWRTCITIATILGSVIYYFIQKEQQNKQFEHEVEMQSKNFETSLIINALNEDDSLKKIKTLVNTGIISDDDKKMNFIIQDTITISSLTNGAFEIDSSIRWVDISKLSWKPNHHKQVGDADLSNFKGFINNNGEGKFIFTITPTRAIKNFIVTLNFCKNDKSYYEYISKPITIPFSKPGISKTVIYLVSNEELRDNAKHINKIKTGWHYE